MVAGGGGVVEAGFFLVVLTTVIVKDRMALFTRRGGKTGSREERFGGRRVLRVRYGRVVGKLTLSSTAATGFVPICGRCVRRVQTAHRVKTYQGVTGEATTSGRAPGPLPASTRIRRTVGTHFTRDEGVLSIHRGCCGRFQGFLSPGRVRGVCGVRGRGNSGFHGRVEGERKVGGRRSKEERVPRNSIGGWV